jgi:hypothetical protein
MYRDLLEGGLRTREREKGQTGGYDDHHQYRDWRQRGKGGGKWKDDRMASITGRYVGGGSRDRWR